MAIDKKAKKILENINSKSAKTTWEDHWQDVANYFLPRKSNITLKRTEGTKGMTRFMMELQLMLLSYYLHLNGMLTNTISPWFVLKLDLR